MSCRYLKIINKEILGHYFLIHLLKLNVFDSSGLTKNIKRFSFIFLLQLSTKNRNMYFLFYHRSSEF